MSTTDHLHHIHALLTPDPHRVKLARDRAIRLIEDLSRRAPPFQVRRPVAFGSVERETALNRFADADFLVVLEEAPLLTSRGTVPAPLTILTRLTEWLTRIRGGIASLGHVEVERQTHSVGFTYRKDSLRIDLVPALRYPRQQHYLIPSRQRQDWIKTRPETLHRRVTQAAPRVRQAIRLLKGWRRARGPGRGWYLPGHALELIALEHATPRTVLGILQSAFGALSPTDGRTNLHLVGEGSGPVVVQDPVSGENLGQKNDWAAKAKLIEDARHALDVLSGPPRLGELTTLFVGESWR